MELAPSADICWVFPPPKSLSGFQSTAVISRPSADPPEPGARLRRAAPCQLCSLPGHPTLLLPSQPWQSTAEPKKLLSVPVSCQPSLLVWLKMSSSRGSPPAPRFSPLLPKQAWGWQGAKGARVAAGCTRMSQPSPNPSHLLHLSWLEGTWLPGKCLSLLHFQLRSCPGGSRSPRRAQHISIQQPVHPSSRGFSKHWFGDESTEQSPQCCPCPAVPFERGASRGRAAYTEDALHYHPCAMQAGLLRHLQITTTAGRSSVSLPAPAGYRAQGRHETPQQLQVTG